MFKFWSKTQAVVALSSAEAELGAALKASQETLEIVSLWKDVGETTREHVLGDASAAIGIIRRMGMGKVRHLNTCWLRVQEKEASRELQCHKVRGSDNSVDLFTKAVEHDSIVRHTDAMGCECMFGRDPIALTVRNLNAKVNMENFAQEVEYRSKTSGRMDAWTRMDLRRDHVDEFEGAMSSVKREAPIEFWKETEEAVPENLGRSRENRLAEKGELEARRRSLSQPEPDRSAQAGKCRDEDEADEAKIDRVHECLDDAHLRTRVPRGVRDSTPHFSASITFHTFSLLDSFSQIAQCVCDYHLDSDLSLIWLKQQTAPYSSRILNPGPMSCAFTRSMSYIVSVCHW